MSKSSTVFVGRDRLAIAVSDATIVYNEGELGRLELFRNLGLSVGKFQKCGFRNLDLRQVKSAEKQIKTSSKQIKTSSKQIKTSSKQIKTSSKQRKTLAKLRKTVGMMNMQQEPSNPSKI